MIGNPVQTPRQWRVLAVVVAIGLLARTLRYTLQFPLWEDEAFLFMNIVDRGFGDLLAPLEQFHQVAPVLFLWVEKVFADLLGAGELSLRLFPFICSVVGLLLFWSLARRLLPGWDAVLAVVLLAVSYPAIRYAGEMKPYAVDLFGAALLLWMWTRWRLDDRRWMWAMTAATPVLVWLSFPAVFVAGGVSLAALSTLWAERRRTGSESGAAWRPWLVFNAVLVAAFVLLLLALRGQLQMQGDWMAVFWGNAESFPPWETPWRLPMWFLTTHTGKFFAFPAGSGNFGSSLTFVLCILGTIRLCRRPDNRDLLVLLFAPFLLHMVAAAMHRYPYGAHFKFAMALAPAICLLAGAGASSVIDLFRDRRRARRWVIGFWLGLFLAVAVGSIVRDVVRPYKTLSDARARGWAQWFWHEAPQRAVVVGMYTDLGLSFSPSTFSELSWSATYLANQRIYSPRHRRGQPPDWGQASAARPLWIVEYRDTHKPYDTGAYDQWLARVSQKFEPGNRVVFPVARYQKNERDLIKIDEVHVLPLTPRGPFEPSDLQMPHR